MRTTDSHPMLQQAARRIAQILDVKVIVMGHSHRVVDEAIGGGARYLNLGSWTNAREGFPHVVVEDGVAQLRYWRGPSAQPAPLADERSAVPVGIPATA
jgi:predicted phosphodiesterase